MARRYVLASLVVLAFFAVVRGLQSTCRTRADEQEARIQVLQQEIERLRQGRVRPARRDTMGDRLPEGSVPRPGGMGS